MDFDDVRLQIQPVIDRVATPRTIDLPLWDGRTAGRVVQVLRTKWKAGYADAARRIGA